MFLWPLQARWTSSAQARDSCPGLLLPSRSSRRASDPEILPSPTGAYIDLFPLSQVPDYKTARTGTGCAVKDEEIILQSGEVFGPFVSDLEMTVAGSVGTCRLLARIRFVFDQEVGAHFPRGFFRDGQVIHRFVACDPACIDGNGLSVRRTFASGAFFFRCRCAHGPGNDDGKKQTMDFSFKLPMVP